MKNQIRQFFFDALVESAKNYRLTMDEKTGRFLAPNGGWAVTRQDAMLAYAYLYLTPGENNPYYQNPEALDTVIRAAQALRDWQYPDGKMEFIKIDGSTWGPTYMCWTFYHWLETYILLRDVLPEEIRKDWEVGIMPAMEDFGKQNTEHIHNIPVWNAMSVHRAGKIFGREDWIENSDKLIKNACLVQDKDGFWPEHKGPTTGYNTVYTHALGLYRFHGGKVDVLETLKRAIRFTQFHLYPNGAASDTVDGRQKYHRTPNGSVSGTTGLPGCIVTRGGFRYIESQLPKYSCSNIALPHTATFLIMLDQIDASFVDPDMGFENFDAPDFSGLYGLGNIVRQNNREISLSAYTAPITESRWGMDRQCFASVWTAKSDLILGGGNSKNDHDLSTFLIKDKDGNLLSYIPTAGRNIAPGTVELDYDTYATCSICGKIADDGKITLTYSIDKKDPDITWQIGLPLKPELSPNKLDIVTYHDGDKNVFEFSGVKVSFEGKCRTTLPLQIFNPYARDDRSAIEDCPMLVNVYPEGDSLTVTIEDAEKTPSPYPKNFVTTD